MEFLNVTNELIVLLTGFLGLIGTGIGTFFAIKSWIKNFKTKNAQEVWALLVEIADKAMTEAERSSLKGADKKTLVLNSIKASAEAAGLDIKNFLDQLTAYIDQTITFVNNMTKK